LSQDAANVLLVMPTRFAAEALAEVLQREAEVIGTSIAASPDEARRQAREFRPEVALVELPPSVGLPLAQDLRRLSAIRVIALGCGDDREVLAWAERDVAGCATLDAPLEFIRSAIKRVLDGKQAWSETATSVLVRNAVELARIRRIADSRLYGLTGRESEVCELLAQGLSNKEIAGILHLQVPTVKNHVQHLFRKVGIRHREDLLPALGERSLRHDRHGADAPGDRSSEVRSESSPLIAAR
jgi:two-component system, NarL family, nitrate/nitrite response regulator NarL